MRKLLIREQAGHFHLDNLGPAVAGRDGTDPFTLVIEWGNQRLEFPEATAHDLFPRFDPRDPRFLEGRFAKTDFVHVIEEDGASVIEAGSGTLYDFFRERFASGHVLRRGTRRVSFSWSGTSQAA